MFSGLKKGSQIYILDKGDNFCLKIGKVEEMNIHPKNEHGYPFAPSSQMVVDLKVRVNEEIAEFNCLNADLNIAKNGDIVVSDSEEAMSAEVLDTFRNSQQVLNSVPYHDKVAKACVPILKTINPQFAKEKEQEEKILFLEERIGNMDEKLEKMFEILSDTLGRRKTKEIGG